MGRDQWDAVLRRDELTVGALGLSTGVAGCSSVLEGDDSENNMNSTETEEPDPDYEGVSGDINDPEINAEIA